MADAAARPAAPWPAAPARPLLRALDGDASPVEPPDGLGHLGLGDDQRRHQPHDVVAGQNREQLLGAAGIGQLAVRNHALEADQQALAAHLGDHGRMPVLDLGQPLAEQQLHPADVVEEAGPGDLVEHGVAGRHRQRIAAEGRAMGSGRDALAGLGGGQHRADREACAEPLGEPHHVGRHAELLIAEHLAEPADAGLHLVEAEQQAALVADLAQRPEEGRLG